MGHSIYEMHPGDTFLFEVKAWNICRPGKRRHATHIHFSNDPPVHFVICLSAAHRLTMVSRVKRMVAQQPDYHNAAAILPPTTVLTFLMYPFIIYSMLKWLLVRPPVLTTLTETFPIPYWRRSVKIEGTLLFQWLPTSQHASVYLSVLF